MKKNYKYIILILILILSFSLYCSCKKSIHEGYGMPMRTEQPISLSEFYTVLNECIENVNKHDIVLNSFNEKYKINKIKLDKNNYPKDNIKNVLNVMKTQDIEISKLSENYIPNSDLDGLISGELLKPIETDLYLKSNYTDSPIDCDPATIKTAIKKYEELVAAEKKKKLQEGITDQDKKDIDMVITTYSAMIVPLKTRLADLESYQNSPGNTKCVPSVSHEDAENLLNGFYLNYIVKIIKSQDIALKTVKKNYTDKLLKVYNSTMNS